MEPIKDVKATARSQSHVSSTKVICSHCLDEIVGDFQVLWGETVCERCFKLFEFWVDKKEMSLYGTRGVE